ncbi:uncharacterized protein BDR25DRAFT_338499 [Lindgomyces ingoldianus]|uniref:Uncharacterized protein n=1 Tax=Lindgomyces ingoldianus TaxID=673940 RepID=A0ACB6REN1_9PLEO|nr:uncharacterized protein BDR25DRAFT_338499 [Lindgomyces ingoldianus]KAF2477729.1 hypothetical protein BDR25DRAFT_338499 [Lindgomyces ingoldianus]
MSLLIPQLPILSANEPDILGLPYPIRDQIYTLLFTDAEIVVRCRDACCNFLTTVPAISRPSIFAIAQTSRLLRQEALPRLFHLAIFDIGRLRGHAKSGEDGDRARFGAAFKDMRRMCAPTFLLPKLGLDFEKFVWSIPPEIDRGGLRELMVVETISACHCDHVPLSETFKCEVQTSDGKFVREIINSVKEMPFSVSFNIELREHCTAWASTIFSISPTLDFRITEWSNYYSLHTMILQFLEDVGLADKLIEVGKRVEDDERQGSDIERGEQVSEEVDVSSI